MAQGKKTDMETMLKIVRYSLENPSLSNEEVGKLCGVSGTTVGKILLAEEAVSKGNQEILNKVTKTSRIALRPIVEDWCKRYNSSINIFYPEDKKAVTEPSRASENEDLFMVKVLEALYDLSNTMKDLDVDVVNLMKDMNANFEQLSNKMTVLYQRQFDPLNEMSGQMADLVDAHSTVLRKVDRISKSVSTFDGNGDTPKTVIDSIEEGFSDVCGKLDTVRFKLEKAIK